jgi:hypothetical protein
MGVHARQAQPQLQMILHLNHHSMTMQLDRSARIMKINDLTWNTPHRSMAFFAIIVRAKSIQDIGK